MFGFDLKSAYHHIDILGDHRIYLGFGSGFAYFVFNVLPFGISTAAYVFTIKLTRAVISYWRSKGYSIIMFLDDGLAI